MTDNVKYISYLMLTLVFLTIVAVLYFRGDRFEREYEFNGIVQVISFGDKRTPKITIDGKKYFLTFTHESFNNRIKSGDSLVKSKNSRVYKLIKRDSKEVFVSE